MNEKFQPSQAAQREQPEALVPADSSNMEQDETVVSGIAGSPVAGESGEIDWKDRYLRLQAQMDNYRKRLQRQCQQEIRAARHEMLLDVLPLADHLELAIEYSQDLEKNPTAEQAQRFRQNLETVLKNFLGTLQRYKVESMNSIDRPFDPKQHEAVGEIADSTLPEGYVAQVVRTGYTEDGRLLRPARVLVSRRER